MNTSLRNLERNQQQVVNPTAVKPVAIAKSDNTQAFSWLLKLSLFFIVAGLAAITFLLHSCISI